MTEISPAFDKATFDLAYKTACGLTEKFAAGADKYLSPEYQEAEVRTDFLDPFWIALGWDVRHETQINPYQQEVKIERGVKMSEGQKRADYAFYLAPDYQRVRFYVEAKKPSRSLRNPKDCFQAVRYGWNSNTPFVILTDFEETLVLDCRAKPDLASATSRVLQTWHYTDWRDEEKFKRFYYRFSREAVSQNSLETYLASLVEIKSASGRQKRLFRTETQAVDVDFLKKLEEWRAHLARDFHAADNTLNAAQLTEATQRALDRLVFLRFLEDKDIELTERVSNWHGDDAWRNFAAASRELDKSYNGVLWKKHGILDNPDFKPWGKAKNAWSDIAFEISSNQSPYLFNLIPIPILGSIYERFLGNEIEIGEVGKVQVTLKPEARKAGGVYYTPDFIVSYIVQNTVGPLVENKTPEEMASLRFADIACGSGSFLLGVYDLLLRRHAEYFAAHPKEAKKAGCENRDGAWILSLKQRRSILENNIFGSDIDAQAVEVAKLSLYLKLLEDETAAGTRQFRLDFDEQILPNLENNIACGNALIGFDVLDGSTLSPEEERKLNPMDWKTTFPQVFRRGGFDAIVGNPPYVRIQMMQETMPQAPEYYRKNYRSAAKGNYDIYVAFVERALQLLNATGKMGYILPHKFFNAQYGAALRGVIAEGNHLREIVHFGDRQIFDGATTYTCLLFADKKSQDSFRFVQVRNVAAWSASGEASEVTIETSKATERDWNFSVSVNAALVQKLEKYPHKLGDFAERIGQGIRTSANEIYVLNETSRSARSVKAIASDAQLVEMKPAIFSSFLQGRDIKRYHINRSGKVVILPYALRNKRAVLMTPDELAASGVLPYLESHHATLAGRENGRMEGSSWYGYVYPKNLELMKSPKILVPDIADRAAFALDRNGEYSFTSGYGITLKPEVKESLEYILGLLNSRLLSLFIQSISTPMRGGFFRYFTQYVEQMPIRPIEFSNYDDKARHDRIVSLVNSIIAARAELTNVKTDTERSYIERKVLTLDRQIDELVYELYELSPEEIEIVEMGSATEQSTPLPKTPSLF